MKYNRKNAILLVAVFLAVLGAATLASAEDIDDFLWDWASDVCDGEGGVDDMGWGFGEEGSESGMFDLEVSCNNGLSVSSTEFCMACMA